MWEDSDSDDSEGSDEDDDEEEEDESEDDDDSLNYIRFVFYCLYFRLFVSEATSYLKAKKKLPMLSLPELYLIIYILNKSSKHTATFDAYFVVVKF